MKTKVFSTLFLEALLFSSWFLKLWSPFWFVMIIWSAGQIGKCSLFHSILAVVSHDLSCYVFLQFKEFELYWGSVFFFSDLFTYFHDFWSQIRVVVLVTPYQEVERKSEWFCGVKFYRSNLEVEWENGVWTKIPFLASGFFVHMRHLLWFLLFFRFFDWVFSKSFSQAIHSSF